MVAGAAGGRGEREVNKLAELLPVDMVSGGKQESKTALS